MTVIARRLLGVDADDFTECTLNLRRCAWAGDLRDVIAGSFLRTPDEFLDPDNILFHIYLVLERHEPEQTKASRRSVAQMCVCFGHRDIRS